MAQPTAYERQYDFTNFSTVSPSAQQPGTQIDAELNAVKTTLDEIMANLALIQRDDTQLANQTVGYRQLKPELSLPLASYGPFDWETGEIYAVRSLVWEDSKLYVCLIGHTATVFADDLAAARWQELIDYSYDPALAALNVLTPAADRLPYFTSASAAALATFTAFGRSLVADADAATARSTLGLVIGTNVQAYDAELAALAGLTSAADRLPYFTGSGTAALATFTSTARSLLDDTSVSAMCTTLGLGTGNSPQFTAVNIGHASDTTIARVSAGVISVEGSNVLLASGLGSITQAYNANLAQLAGLSLVADRLPYANGTGTLALATFTAAGRALVDDADAAAQRTTLGLGTAATQNTGTSGATVPLLNGANTHSGATSFTGGLTVTHASQSVVNLRAAAGTGGFGVGRSVGGADAQDFFIYDYAASASRFAINSSGHITVSQRVGIGNVAPATNFALGAGSTGSTERAGFFDAAHASFADNILLINAARAANSAYSFLYCTSGGFGDVEFRAMGDGNAYADGSWTGGGADYAEYFEWADGNPEEEDRRGFSVVLAGHKIRKATAEDNPEDVIGVVSGNPSVVGDAAWNKWNGKYLRDDFGTYVLDEGGHRLLNPAFDPKVPYVERADRPEWDAVGFVGKLRVRVGQPVRAHWRKMRDVSADVEEWLVR